MKKPSKSDIDKTQLMWEWLLGGDKKPTDEQTKEEFNKPSDKQKNLNF